MELTSLTTKGGVPHPLGPFTVLVGPNNVGKSQTLRDIHRFMLQGRGVPGKVLSTIALKPPGTREDLLAGLTVTPHATHADHTQVHGMGPTLQGADETTFNNPWLAGELESTAVSDAVLNAFGKFRVAFLDAGSRLAVAASTEAINLHTSAPSNLLQGLFAAGEEVESEFRTVFKGTFGVDIRLDYSGMTRLSLRVAREMPAIPEDPRKAFAVMRSIPAMDDQGDGFRSFAGVVLSLLLAKRRVILLDEPEAFLHPAQARQLGRWLALHASASGSQVIVATHNSHFLQGILSANKPVDILRLKRSGDDTAFHLMPAKETAALASNPLLSGQSVLDAVFHRGVVVCEADSDRIVYQTVADRLLDERDLLFIHSQGKHTVSAVCALLRASGVPTAGLVDIDVLGASEELEVLGEALGVDATTLASWEGARAMIAKEIQQVSEATLLDTLRIGLETLLTEVGQKSHTLGGARSALARLRLEARQWAVVKRDGVTALSEDGQKIAKDLLGRCSAQSLFVVPVGELEGWIDVGTRQKKKWVPLALDRIVRGDCPDELLSFVAEIRNRLLSAE